MTYHLLKVTQQKEKKNGKSDKNWKSVVPVRGSLALPSALSLKLASRDNGVKFERRIRRVCSPAERQTAETRGISPTEMGKKRDESFRVVRTAAEERQR